MSTVNVHNLPDNLRAIQLETEAHARDYGLDFYETIFEVLDYDELSEIAALGGFPTRYPHWRFGMEYQHLAKGYRYGLQKIYEMVINNDPCYAYLLRCNQMVDQKLVMAHVYGHNDFFKNNIWFSQTNRKMMDEVANHGSRIRSHMERNGEETVESFIDSCLSLENLIDIYSPLDQALAIKSTATTSIGTTRNRPSGALADEVSKQGLHGRVRQSASGPQGRSSQARGRAGKREDQALVASRAARARRPRFVSCSSTRLLKSWQYDVLTIIREEAYYFAPQGQTKIMNEGWASFWHSTIMTQKTLHPSELLDYADHHSGAGHTARKAPTPTIWGSSYSAISRSVGIRDSSVPSGTEYDNHEALVRKWDKKDSVWDVKRSSKSGEFTTT